MTHAVCPDTHMTAQGVPGYIMISREIRLFRAHYDNTCRQNEEHYQELKGAIEGLFEELPKKGC